MCMCTRVLYMILFYFFAQKKILLYFSPSWGEINLHATDVSPLLSARTLSPDLTAWVSWWNTCIKGSPLLWDFTALATVAWLQSIFTCSHSAVTFSLAESGSRCKKKNPFINVSTTFVPVADSTCDFNSPRANQQNARAYLLQQGCATLISTYFNLVAFRAKWHPPLCKHASLETAPCPRLPDSLTDMITACKKQVVFLTSEWCCTLTEESKITEHLNVLALTSENRHLLYRSATKQQ